jgi:hypothetical protein
MEYKHQNPMPKFASEGNQLRVGPTMPTLYASAPKHPVEKQSSAMFTLNQEKLDLQKLSVNFGSHMAARVVLERNILAGSRRQGAYGSSMFGLKSHMGKYQTIDFEDILNDPNESPFMDKETVHERCEKVYGM